MLAFETRILVVDDQGVMRKIIKKYLEELGFSNIVETDDGASAWPIYMQAISEGKPFGLVISDWNMPLMPGIELLMKVRCYPEMADTPFLMLTAEADRGSVATAAQWQVTGYIAKPFKMETLQQKLETIFPTKKASGG